jgi:hypothetical protein
MEAINISTKLNRNMETYIFFNIKKVMKWKCSYQTEDSNSFLFSLLTIKLGVVFQWECVDSDTKLARERIREIFDAGTDNKTVCQN